MVAAAILRVLPLFVLPAALAQQPPLLPVPAAAADELRFGAQLPEFEARDIGGRTWRLADLRGKYTVVYIWGALMASATDRLDKRNPHARYSLHGLPDLPELQRFYDKVRTSRNIQVLTFCQDYDYTHAPDYMRQSGHTFPVIADWTLIRKLFPMVMEYAVVNPDVRLSNPFREWSLGRVLIEVEKAAAQ